MVSAGCLPLPTQPLPTFHGKVYVAKKARKSSDLPSSMTNASAAQRRIIEPDDKRPIAGKDTSKVKPKKLVQKRINTGGDELQNQIDAGWVDVNLSLMAVTDLIQFAKKVTAGAAGIHTIKLECFPKEYDRLEAEARKQQTKPKYSLAGPEHAALAKSTAELMCHPQLKGKVASAIKEVLIHGPALEELVIGMNLPGAIWKALCSSLAAHQSLHTLSLAGSAIGDSTLQGLVEGLRANQTVSELNLSGCKLSDDGAKVLASIIKAKAAEADVQEWHEGLREYPDLSLAPLLRKQQFRARNREIKGRVQARCGGLQVLHLAENKISDVGAQMLVDALVMDRGMKLLDLSANRLTTKSGKAFGRLMQKHKGLLRVDLRNNAQGLSGVLQMLPKENAKSAHVLPDRHSDAAQAGAALRLDHSSAAQQDSVSSVPAKAPVTASRKGLVPVMTSDGHTPIQMDSDGTQSGKENVQHSQVLVKRQSSKPKSKAGCGAAAAGKPPRRPKHAKQASPAQAGFLEFEFAPQPQHAENPNTESSEFLEFEFTSQLELQSQPTASMPAFEHADGLLLGQYDQAYPDSQQNQHPEPADSSYDHVNSASFGGWASPVRPQHGVTDCSIAQHDTRPHSVDVEQGAQLFSTAYSSPAQNRLESSYSHGHVAALHQGSNKGQMQSMQQPSSAAYAVQPLQNKAALTDALDLEATCMQEPYAPLQQAAPTVSSSGQGTQSFQRRMRQDKAGSRSRHSFKRPMSAAVGSASLIQTADIGGAASVQGMNVGRQAVVQSAAVDITAPVQSAAVAREAPVQSAAVDREAATQIAFVSRRAPMQQEAAQLVQQPSAASRHAGLQWSIEQPTSVWPESHLVHESEAQTTQYDGADPGQASAIAEATGRSKLAQQASVNAAAAAEAVKLDEWKAELLGEMRSLRSSVQAAVAVQHSLAESTGPALEPAGQKVLGCYGPVVHIPVANNSMVIHRAEAPAAGGQGFEQQLQQDQAAYSQARPDKLQPKPRQSRPGKKKKAGFKVKAAGKSSKGQLSDEAVDAMLDGQQHMLGELNQVMQSLDHLVSDIEHARTFAEEEQFYEKEWSNHQQAEDELQDPGIGAEHGSPSKQHAVDRALADITAQLSSQYDLHDTWSQQ